MADVRQSYVIHPETHMRTLRVLVAVAVVLSFATAARAQTATGQIVGTVRDTSGGVMPNDP